MMYTYWAGSEDIEPRLDASFYSPELIAATNWIKGPIRTASIDEAASLVTDGTHVTPDYRKCGVIFISATNIDCCFLNMANGYKYISRDEHQKLERQNCSPVSRDVLVSKSGKIGTACVYDGEPECSVFESIAIVRPKAVWDERYISLFLNTDAALTQINRMQKGAVQKHLHLEELREIRIPEIPKLQNAIGNKVRKAERLRELAEASKNRLGAWLGKATRQDLATPEVTTFLNHIPADTIQDARWVDDLAFGDRLDPWPTHVAPSTVRKHLLTHGHTVPFGRMLSTVYHGKANPPAGVPGCHHVSILDVDNDGHVNWSDAEKNRYESAGIAIKPGDILFPTLNPNETRVAVVPLDKTGDNAASSEFVVLNPRQGYEAYPFLIAAILRSPWVRVQVAFLTRSSSLSRRRIDDDDLGYIHIPWVDDGTLGDLNRLLSEAVDARHEAVELINAAKADIESLIDGTLDQAALVAEGQAIDDWLVKHPRPDAS